MKPNKVYGVYFSPTGNTKKCVQTISRQLDDACIDIDLTDSDTRRQTFEFGSDGLVILGVPVYAGRVPCLYDGLLERLKGNQTPAVFVVTYGNRDYDDALLELKTTCEANGFNGIAAAAFIGQHTFLDRVAMHRPDDDDTAVLKGFASSISEKLSHQSYPYDDLHVKGNSPYRERSQLPFFPLADDSCTGCGRCVAVCPVQAIDAESIKSCDTDKCIRCLACVKVCQQKARTVAAPQFAALLERLEKLAEIRKQPEMFL